MAGRYFFIHCQKTAGTSLSAQLRQIFEPDSVLPHESDSGDINSVLSMAFLKDRLETRGDDIKLVMGHFPFCATEMMGPDCKTFTVLRDPVERILSYLRHHKKLTPEDAGKSLEDIYEDPFRFHGLIHNHMVKMFSLQSHEAGDGVLTNVEFEQAHLDRAKQTLCKVDVVGLQENYEGFCDLLSRRFGWPCLEVLHYNQTRKTETVTEEFRKRIARDNAFDVKFYDFACTLVAARDA